MKYRTLSVVDAEKFWEMMDQLDHETKYMLYEPGERTKDLAKIESVMLKQTADLWDIYPQKRAV